jgi:transposase, IS5 family
MRKRFETQTEFGQTPIGKVAIPTKSRDELPAVLAGLQWIFTTPELNEEVFALLEEHVIGETNPLTGRPGMEIWHILVLGTLRLALNCDYDRLSHMATYDNLIRQIMGMPVFGITPDSLDAFHHRTISDNVCRFDEALLAKINDLVVKYGLPIIKKNENEKLNVKTDSFVVETNVHYPTDANLLWDAGRKCIELVTQLCEAVDIDGWRKHSDWKSRLKSGQRNFEKVASKGGPNKPERVVKTARIYLDLAGEVEQKVSASINTLRGKSLTPAQFGKLDRAVYFQSHLIKHIDLLERRIIQGETIPHEEKVFSLFEPHTDIIKKGKMMPPVEFGRRLLISTEQRGFILDYKILEGGNEHAEAIPAADRLLAKLGEGVIDSISFDKGFSSEENRELIGLFIKSVVMPKAGKKNAEDIERESGKPWKRLRNKHSAVESDINCLEQHGLDRCEDKGWRGYQRYIGLGVLAYNLHKIGAKLIAMKRADQDKQDKPKQKKLVAKAA